MAGRPGAGSAEKEAEEPIKPGARNAKRKQDRSRDAEELATGTHRNPAGRRPGVQKALTAGSGRSTHVSSWMTRLLSTSSCTCSDIVCTQRR